jgi:hypothetical protein
MLSGFCVRKASLETAGNRGVNGLPACHSRAQNYGSVRVSSPAKSAVPGRKKTHYMMSTDASGYMPRSCSEVGLCIVCLNGETFTLKLSASSLGREVYATVSQQLPLKKGGQFILHHLDSRLMLHQTLQEQGIVGKSATLSCTFASGLCFQFRFSLFSCPQIEVMSQ